MLKLKSLLDNRFFQGGFVYVAAAFVINFINYLFNFFSARLLGPLGYSEITTLFSYLTIFAIPTLVISSFIIQKIASTVKNKFAYASALERYFWKKAFAWRYLIVLTLLCSPLIPRISNLTPLSGIIVIPLIYLSLVATFYGAMMQGLQLLILFSLIGITSVLLKLLGPLLLLLHWGNFSTIIIFIILSSALPIIISMLSLRSHFNSGKGNQPGLKIEKKVRSLIHNREFLLILFSTLALNLFNNFDIIFVKKYFSSQDAGIYSSWSLLAKIIFYSIGPLISVSFIFFSARRKNNIIVLRFSLIFLTLAGIISYLLYSNFSAFVVNLFFGKRFFSVLQYLGLSAVFGWLYGMSAFINNYYLAKKSYFSLVLPALIPFYLILIFTLKLKLVNIMYLNIFFAAVALIIYLAIYIKEELNFHFKSA